MSGASPLILFIRLHFTSWSTLSVKLRVIVGVCVSWDGFSFAFAQIHSNRMSAFISIDTIYVYFSYFSPPPVSFRTEIIVIVIVCPNLDVAVFFFTVYKVSWRKFPFFQYTETKFSEYCDGYFLTMIWWTIWMIMYQYDNTGRRYPRFITFICVFPRAIKDNSFWIFKSSPHNWYSVS